MSGRRGFTLVELLVVALLGVVLLLATYEVLVVNQRTYTVQNEQVKAQQSTSAALGILFGELREVSSRGGDILAYGQDGITIRAMRSVGLACQVTLGPTPVVRVWTPYDRFEVGDSVFVFAANVEASSSDDAWIPALVTAADSTVTCGAQKAMDLTFAGQSAAFAADSVRVGAPMRSFERYRYELSDQDGDGYLVRTAGAGTAVPLVGPLSSGLATPPGLELAYFDATGAVAASATDIREIRVIVRTVSAATKRGGAQVGDSITASVYTRN